MNQHINFEDFHCLYCVLYETLVPLLCIINKIFYVFFFFFCCFFIFVFRNLQTFFHSHIHLVMKWLSHSRLVKCDSSLKEKCWCKWCSCQHIKIHGLRTDPHNWSKGDKSPIGIRTDPNRARKGTVRNPESTRTSSCYSGAKIARLTENG